MVELIELPACELGKLDEIFDLITCSMAQPICRENLALALEKENYVQKLLELFRMCEDLENLDGCHHLYNIFRTLFLLNKPSLLSIMFQPDLIMDVIGCLEYDPSKPHPIKHRQYLQNTSRHKDVVSLENPELMNKIHLTYKIMYIQEVILPTPSLFEENMMSALNSIILFNKTEIVNAIQVNWEGGRERVTVGFAKQCLVLIVPYSMQRGISTYLSCQTNKSYCDCL